MQLPSLILPNDGLSRRLVSTCIGTLLASTSCIALVSICLALTGSGGRYPLAAAVALGICLPSISIVIRYTSQSSLWRLSFVPVGLFALLFLVAGSDWVAPVGYAVCVGLILAVDFKWPMRSLAPLSSSTTNLAPSADVETSGDEEGLDKATQFNDVTREPDRQLLNDEVPDPVHEYEEDLEEEFEEEGDLLPPNASQQVTRLSNAGVDVAEGVLRAKLDGGSRQCSLHVALCPTMDKVPSVQVFQLDGPEATITVAESKPYGLRIDVRLTVAAMEQTEVLLHFSASSG